MANTGKSLVMTATYNEIENLPALVDAIFQHAPNVDVLVVDDNSPDGTGRWCDERAATDPRLFCLHREGKLGLGSAIVAGMRYAIDKGYQFVINMDADFSHDPKYLGDLIGGMTRGGQADVDVMIGSRYIPGGAIKGWPFTRHMMSRCINLYSRWLLGLRPKDCSGGYRCYRTSRLARLDFTALISQGYSFQEEILWRLKRQGCRLDETPIVFVNRTKGSSKINLRESFRALGIIASLGGKNLMGK